MPNWCANTVVLSHTDTSMIEKAVEGFEKGELMQTFIPCPEELMNTAKGYVGDDEQAAHEAQQARNIEKYGFPTWYEFCTSMWGTKWDVGGDDCSIIRIDDHAVQFTFQSAWSPPIEGYASLEELGFNVDGMYYEPGMMFCGRYTTACGENSVEIIGDSEWVAENVDPDIIEAFNIVEQMEEYEDEDEDEE